SVPKGSNSGTRLRLKGKGIAPEGTEPGDQYVTLELVLPEPQDDALRDFAAGWAAGLAHKPRQEPWARRAHALDNAAKSGATRAHVPAFWWTVTAYCVGCARLSRLKRTRRGRDERRHHRDTIRQNRRWPDGRKAGPHHGRRQQPLDRLGHRQGLRR